MLFDKPDVEIFGMYICIDSLGRLCSFGLMEDLDGDIEELERSHKEQVTSGEVLTFWFWWEFLNWTYEYGDVGMLLKVEQRNMPWDLLTAMWVLKYGRVRMKALRLDQTADELPRIGLSDAPWWFYAF